MPMYILGEHILAQQAQKLIYKSTAVLAVYIPQWCLSFRKFNKSNFYGVYSGLRLLNIINYLNFQIKFLCLF